MKTMKIVILTEVLGWIGWFWTMMVQPKYGIFKADVYHGAYYDYPAWYEFLVWLSIVMVLLPLLYMWAIREVEKDKIKENAQNNSLPPILPKTPKNSKNHKGSKKSNLH